MNNSEKAAELSKKFARQYHANTWPEWSDDEEFHYSNGEINNACNEMAEWKERQMIEKACEWLELHMQCGVHPQNVSSTIKQFKKAMEE